MVRGDISVQPGKGRNSYGKKMLKPKVISIFRSGLPLEIYRSKNITDIFC